MIDESTLTKSILINVVMGRHDGSMLDRPTVTPSDAPIVAPPGLKGVIVTDTAVGSVRGDEGFFHYRQYDAGALARNTAIEDIWHLLIVGHLPDDREAVAFRQRIGAKRVVAPETLELVADLARRVQPPHLVLQAALPLLLPDARPTLDLEHEQRVDDVLTIGAAVPTVLAVVRSVREGRPLSAADPGRGHAADWLAMASDRRPSEQQVRAVETYLAATVDHGLNASTFATRVVTSTGADAAGALGAGVAALAGPLHGGAPARALGMIDEIGDPAATEAWLTPRLERGEKIMGFGHAVYRADDPRSTLMREVALGFGGPLVERAIEIERRILRQFRAFKPDAVIVTNVEFYAGIVLHLAGLPPDAFTSCFTVSRVIGWGAHLVEQAADNKIVRPSSRYVGPAPLAA
jgi:citrate synthase